MILKQAEQYAWRVGMAYWVANPGDPIHHLPTQEVLGYRQYDPRNPPKLPGRMNELKIKTDGPDWALRGEEGHHLNDLTKDIQQNGMKSPVEVLTDGQRAFLGDGTHRATAAHEAGLPHVPAHVMHMGPEDLDFYRDQMFFMRNRDAPPAGPGVRKAVS